MCFDWLDILHVSVTTVGLGVGLFNVGVSPLGPSFNIFWVFVAFIVVFTILSAGIYNMLFYWILPTYVYKDSGELN